MIDTATMTEQSVREAGIEVHGPVDSFKQFLAIMRGRRHV
jgi:hypothetical protein